MNPWSIGMMSNEEKKNILDQHKSIYDGWRTMQPKVSNTQPLYVQDFANDKVGVTVDNKFNVKGYTNMKINESSHDKSMCSECGGMMREGECSECGWSDSVSEETQQERDIKHEEDINLSNKFDYVEDEMSEISISDLKKGSKYKFKHPGFEDFVEYEDEFDSEDDGDKIYKFKGDFSHALPKKGVESFVDIFDEDVDVDSMDSDKGTYSQAPHQVQAPDGMGDLGDSDIDHEDEIRETEQGDPYENEESAYDFISGGPFDGSSLPNYSYNEPFEELSSAFDDDDVNPEKEEDYLDGIDDEDDDVDIINDKKLPESIDIQKNRILEMMNRMKSF
jgi:hypothetical protein